MAKYLIRKLEHYTRLSADDKQALERAASERVRQFGPREDLIREGDEPRHLNLILEGFACRYKVLEDGRRSITNFLVPGDLCDLRMFILKQMDHSIGTITPARIAEVPRDVFLDLTDAASTRLGRALWWNSLVEEAVAREWVVNLGQRDAIERMAHLLCELFIRLRCIGLTQGDSCELPTTQAELADALGLSVVHTNRVLQDLRGQGLVIFKGKTLTVPDLDALMAVGLFNGNYLHLDREGREFDANEA